MCGIIGGISLSANAAATVYDGLLRLEYRGYDSAGISALDGGAITTVKRGGRVSALGKDAAALAGRAAIGHTRWATHGAPSDINAHPHNSGAFSLVHNGIIENYAELKAELVARGYSFASETDSEVIVKLIDDCFSGDFPAAVAAALRRLKGSFAVAVLYAGFDGVIVARYKSSLIVSGCKEGIFAASDVPALPADAENIFVLEDGDIAVITSGGVRFYDFYLNPVARVQRHIVRGEYDSDAGNYPHFMLKEICQDARTVADTAEAFSRSADLAAISSAVGDAEEIIITGCGTAYNAGLMARRYFEQAGKRHVRIEIASELRYYPPADCSRALVIAVSQSGETADTVEAVRLLKARGATIIAVTNCGYSAITRTADIVVPVCAGAEICVAATKSYLGQLVALRLISRARSALAEAEELVAVARKMPEVLACDEMSSLFADECAQSSAVFFLGRGADYDAAVEASLKLKEVSYIFSDAYPAGELKHGTLALVDESTLSVFVICQPLTAEKCINAVHEVLCRGGRVAVITDDDALAAQLVGIPVWKLPAVNSELSPLLAAVALQLTAYKAAVLLERNPDKPRNLAKSVTVE